jgi:hypothetical protein
VKRERAKDSQLDIGNHYNRNCKLLSCRISLIFVNKHLDKERNCLVLDDDKGHRNRLATI